MKQPKEKASRNKITMEYLGRVFREIMAWIIGFVLPIAIIITIIINN